MQMFKYYSSFWALWYSEQEYNNLMNDIEDLKKKYYQWFEGIIDEM